MEVTRCTVNLLSYKPVFSDDKWHLHGKISVKYVSLGLPSSGESGVKTLVPGMENIFHTKVEASSKKVTMVASYSLKQFGDIQPGENKKTLTPTGYNEYDLGYTLLFKPVFHTLFTIAIQRVKQNDIPVYHKLQNSGYERYHINLQKRDFHRFGSETNLTGIIKKINVNGFVIRGEESMEIQQLSAGMHTISNDNIITKGLTIDVQTTGRKIIFNTGADIYQDHVSSQITRIDPNLKTTETGRGTFADGSSSTNYSLFMLGKAELGTTRLNAGIRLTYGAVEIQDTLFDRFTLNTPCLVWNLGVSKSLTPWMNWVASVNCGFRTPNISDLSSFGITDYRFEIPNTNLTSEKSITYETGYKISSGRFGSSGFVYFSDLKNLITVKSTSYQGNDSISYDGINYYNYYTKVNAQKSFITGAEIDLTYRIAKNFRFDGMACYTFGENLSANEPVSRIPPLNGSVNISYKVNRHFSSRIEWLYAGKQGRLSSGDKKDIRIPPGGTPSWNNLNIHFNISCKAYQINGGVNNVFNAAYRTHGSGVDGYGRNFWLQLSALL
jgi:hemoglobin/transferrin/lactoferrin receptor protein